MTGKMLQDPVAVGRMSVYPMSEKGAIVGL